MTSKFSAKVAAFAEIAKGLTDDVIENTVEMLEAQLIEKSPVGNPDLWKSKAPKGYVGGTFRANWRVTAGEPEPGFMQRTKGYFPESSRELNAAAIKAGRGQRTWTIYNNAPYALALEYGHSTQAPAGMVGITVANFPSILTEAVMKARDDRGSR